MNTEQKLKTSRELIERLVEGLSDEEETCYRLEELWEVDRLLSSDVAKLLSRLNLPPWTLARAEASVHSTRILDDAGEARAEFATASISI